MALSLKKNISFRFSFAMVCVAAIIISGFAVVLIWDISNILKTELERRVFWVSNLAKMSLAVPLREHNTEYLNTFIESLFLDETVVYVSILEHDHVIMNKTHPDFLEEEWSFFEQSPFQFLSNVSDIIYEERNIGALRIALSKQAIQSDFMIRIAAIIAVTVILVVAISLTSFFMTKRYIVRPLSRLVELAKCISEGKLDMSAVSSIEKMEFQDEIGSLASAFQGMIAYLQDIFNVAMHISYGNLSREISPLSEKDELGSAFQDMTEYLMTMGGLADEISAGDLRGRIVPRSYRDQLGVAFIQMQEGLISLISQIRVESDALTTLSSQVLKIAAKNTETLEHVGYIAETTSIAMEQLSVCAREIRVNMEHLNSSAEQTNGTIEQTVSSMKDVAEHSRNLSQFADETLATVLNIVNSLEKIAHQAERSKKFSETTTTDAASGRESVEQVISSMRAISEVTEHISGIILRLQHRSQEIDTILDVINEVAEQTSLLALNASIIAAQAGVHGRGFAVVADEIKDLATRVGTSTQKIAQIIRAVQCDSSDAVHAIKEEQQKVENGVMVAHQARAALQKIRESAGNSLEVATEIATVVRQQTSTHTDIARSIQNVSRMIADITRATQQEEQNSSELFKAAKNMNVLGGQVLTATQEQQRSTDYVADSMEQVLSSVLENSQTVQQLAKSASELALKADMLRQQMKQFILPSHDAS